MRSKRTPESLSQFEWQIMSQIWERGRSSAREVLEALPEEHQRAYTTIQTYLERLIDKGYLAKEKVGLVNFYSPLIVRDHAIQQETNRFVDQVFAGSKTRLAAFLLGEEQISAADFQKIKAMLGEDRV